ncbi:GbsR/MarR family transcriptional regulator [Paraliobacillus salinarum]|uniref:GbsR/MarR family transcriptional regulator n=1 Tax=Paraliobacillus salinarum TaxID=1158996 RepID=UPI0015F68D63|nr:transcriptional regulator [Paraliobacillus salinarum]
MVTNNNETMQQNIFYTFSKTIEFFSISPAEAQLFAMLYLKEYPMTLDEMGQALGKSKTAIGTSIRTLSELNLVRRVWKKGIRKDLYETHHDLYSKFMKTYINNWISHTNNQKALLSDVYEQMNRTNLSEEETQLLNKLTSIIEFHQSIIDTFTTIDPKKN